MKNENKIVVLFDVNETLLDMSPLKQRVNALLDAPGGFQTWFGLLLQYSLVDNVTDNYHDFPTIADATLKMAANAFGRTLDAEKRRSALSLMKELQVYPDVEPGLKKLHDNGYRMATLTNSPESVLVAQLKFSGITDYFEKKLSIDSIRRYKPAICTYQWAAEQLSVTATDLIMIAAHGWDIAGASMAGLKTGFIARNGQSLYPLVSAPDFQGPDLISISEAIINAHAVPMTR